MFKNLQNYILLRYPLLWNTRFVPMMIFGLALNLIAFICGYIDGTIDFSGVYEYGALQSFIMIFIVLIWIISSILWLLKYFKNNSFKAVYHKSKNAIFYEFIQILLILNLFAIAPITYQFAEKLHQRSYFSKAEFNRRWDIIQNAKLFIESDFHEPKWDTIAMGMIYKDQKINDSIFDWYNKNSSPIKLDHVKFHGKKYSLKSLINRSVEDDIINNYEYEYDSTTKRNYNPEDFSITESNLKLALHKNDEIFIKRFMDDYLKMIHEHKLHTNLTTNIWYDAMVKNKELTNFELINPYPARNIENQENKASYYSDNYIYKLEGNNNYNRYEYTEAVVDSASVYDPNRDGYDPLKEAEKREIKKLGKKLEDKYIFNEYELNDLGEKYSHLYTEHYMLQEKYEIINNAYYREMIDDDLFIIFYFTLGIALTLLSLKISKFLNLIVSAVISGILIIIVAITTALTFRNEKFAILLSLIIYTIIFVIFYLFIKKNKTTKFSKLFVNMILWGIPFIIPFISTVIHRYFWIDYFDESRKIYIRGINDYLDLSTEEYFILVLVVQYIFSIILMLFYSQLIRKWKSLPEQ